MGYNSTLLILNDALHLIRDYPEDFSKALLHQIAFGEDKDLADSNEVGAVANSFGFKNHVNPFAIMTVQHADFHSLILVGGNYASVIGHCYAGNRGHHTREDVIKSMDSILAQWDLKVVKK
jgi:hypothetical protein